MAQRTENIGAVLTAVAGEALATKYKFVKLSSGKAMYAGAGEKALGVLSDTADLNGAVGIYLGNVVLVEVGTAGVTEMAEVQSDANGKAVVKSTGISNGISLDTEVAGGFARILLR